MEFVLRITVLIAYLSLIVVIMVTSTLTLVVIWKDSRQTCHTTTFLIGNVAFVDLCFAIMFLHGIILVFYDHDSVYHCVANSVLFAMVVLASIVFTFLNSFDRYLYLKTPLRYSVIMNISRIKKVVAFAWIFIVLFAVLPTLVFTPFLQYNTCIQLWRSPALNVAWGILLSVFFLNFLFTAGMYVSLYRVVKKSQQQRQFLKHIRRSLIPTDFPTRPVDHSWLCTRVRCEHESSDTLVQDELKGLSPTSSRTSLENANTNDKSLGLSLNNVDINFQRRRKKDLYKTKDDNEVLSIQDRPKEKTGENSGNDVVKCINSRYLVNIRQHDLNRAHRNSHTEDEFQMISVQKCHIQRELNEDVTHLDEACDNNMGHSSNLQTEYLSQTTGLFLENSDRLNIDCSGADDSNVTENCSSNIPHSLFEESQCLRSPQTSNSDPENRAASHPKDRSQSMSALTSPDDNSEEGNHRSIVHTVQVRRSIMSSHCNESGTKTMDDLQEICAETKEIKSSVHQEDQPKLFTISSRIEMSLPNDLPVESLPPRQYRPDNSDVGASQAKDVSQKLRHIDYEGKTFNEHATNYVFLSSRDFRTLKVLFLMLLVYTSLWTPAYVMTIISMYTFIDGDVKICVAFIALFNCLMNFFVYPRKVPRLRAVLEKMVHCIYYCP